MSVTVYFANVSKKRNSTYRGTFAVSYDCNLKAPTSLDRPTFLVSAETMDYNAAKWGDRYYFIDDVVSVRNGQWEVSCVLDVLATYKTEITGSTQFVTYSADSSLYDKNLVDTRMVQSIKPDMFHAEEATTLFDDAGFYVLTVNGKSGCLAYMLTFNQIKLLIDRVSTWESDGISGVISGTAAGLTYDWGTTEKALQSMGEMLTQTGFIGNAYSMAPQMIRSCIWVPFNPTRFRVSDTVNPIYLGNFDTGVMATECRTTPVSDIVVFQSIPFYYDDWRRTHCENVRIYLPFVGAVTLPATNEFYSDNPLAIQVSCTATDGAIAYSLGASSPFATYGGSCCANYPIGINQQASAGSVMQTMLAGAEKMVNIAVNSNLSFQSIAGTIFAEGLAGVNANYETQNVRQTTAASCIGSFGGGVGSAFYKKIMIDVITNRTAQDPADIRATMGHPVMKNISLSGLTGFCQCANAHIAAAAQARELDAIDNYLNTGFFIE